MQFLDEVSDEEIERKPFGGKDGTIFVVECRRSMFGKIIDCSPFSLAMKVIRNSIANTAISCSSDEIGVILLGTEKTQNSYEFEHIFVVQNLKQAGADLVILFDECLSQMNETDFSNKYGINGNYSLAELLWLCNGIFNKEKKKYYSKNVLLFTIEDHPFKDDRIKQNQSVQRARDLKSNSINIDVVPLLAGFDFDKFYNGIITNPRFEKSGQLKSEQLFNRIRMRSHKERIFSIVPFSLGAGVEISISVFVLVRETKKPFSIKLDRRTNAPLSSESRMVTESGEVVDKSSIFKGIDYGERTVYTTLEEMKTLKSLEPKLTLLGFKPKQCLHSYYYKKPSYFIIPNESKVKGSNRLFNALLQQCHRRRVFVLCTGCFRSTSGMSLIALIPQFGNNEDQPGFHAVILPFSEDIRDLNLLAASPVDVPSELIDITKNIVKSLKRDYVPEIIQNPALQKFYAGLEALALQSQEAEKVSDDLKPDLSLIEKVIAEFRAEFEFFLPESKAEGNNINNPPDDLRVAAENGKLGRFTVKQLTAFCESRSIPCGKKKADIIYAIKNYYDVG